MDATEMPALLICVYLFFSTFSWFSSCPLAAPRHSRQKSLPLLEGVASSQVPSAPGQLFLCHVLDMRLLFPHHLSVLPLKLHLNTQLHPVHKSLVPQGLLTLIMSKTEIPVFPHVPVIPGQPVRPEAWLWRRYVSCPPSTSTHSPENSESFPSPSYCPVSPLCPHLGLVGDCPAGLPLPCHSVAGC